MVLLSDWRFPDAPLYGAATFGEAVPFWFEPGLDVDRRVAAAVRRAPVEVAKTGIAKARGVFRRRE